MLDADMFFAEECTPEKPCSWPLLCGACSARAARHCLRIAGFVEGSDPPALTRKGNVKIIFSYEVQQYVRGSVVLQLLTRGGGYSSPKNCSAAKRLADHIRCTSLCHATYTTTYVAPKHLSSF